MTTAKRYSTIAEYISDQPPKVAAKLEDLRKCILKAAPQATELINYNIPAFALVKGGKRDHQIMMAGYTQHVGLYPHPSVMEAFHEELKAYKAGKGSVQFPINKPLPENLIDRMLKHRQKLLGLA